MKNKTIISTFALFAVLTFVGLFSNNPYVAFGSIFFAGAFFFVGIGLATEKKEIKSPNVHLYGKGWIEENQEAAAKVGLIKEPSFKGRKGQGICIHCGLETQPLHLCKCPERNYKEGTWKSKVTAEEKRMKKVIIGVDFAKVEKKVSKKK